MRWRNVIVVVVMLVAVACIQPPGPVTQGPHNTAAVQSHTNRAIDNNTKALVRCILAKYEEKLGRIWRVWKKHDDRLLARQIPKEALERMTPEQVSRWAKEVSDSRLKLARGRDNKLADYDRTRSQELAQAAANANQAKAGVTNLIESWRRQGEVGQFTADNIINVFEAGLAAYQQVQHIRNLRKEAEAAAKAKEAEEAELAPEE